MPSKTLRGKNPIELLGLCPCTSLFHVPPKVFGCICFVHIPKHQRDKLDPKAVKCMFVGYPGSQKGYKRYAPGRKGRVLVTMEVSFHEDIPFFSSASKELLPEGNAQENVPPVDYVSPPLYSFQAHHMEKVWKVQSLLI